MKARPINLAPDSADKSGGSGTAAASAAAAGAASAAGATALAIRLNITSDPANLRQARRAVEDLCRRGRVPQRTLEDVGLCLNEALANVIRHAYGGATDRPIEIDASVDGQLVELRIRDWGAAVDTRRLGSTVSPGAGANKPPAAAATRDPLTPGGLGLICLRQLMDRVEYAPQPDSSGGGTLLTMTRSTRRT